jgi:hypothetical protein
MISVAHDACRLHAVRPVPANYRKTRSVGRGRNDEAALGWQRALARLPRCAAQHNADGALVTGLDAVAGGLAKLNAGRLR